MNLSNKIDIRGFLEMSLIDWDGKICSVIFMPGCNFRCGFCHNSALIIDPHKLPQYNFDGVLEYMVEHKDFIDGLVFTGGEPTLNLNLPEAIKAVKEKGLAVKLDTNGTNPEMLEKLLKDALVDYVAMDLKAPLLPALYDKATGTSADVEKIKKSLTLLKDSKIDYEIRTTVVPILLDESEMMAMAQSLAGMKKWVLQQFVPKNVMDKELAEVSPYSDEKMQTFIDLGNRFVPTSKRGF